MLGKSERGFGDAIGSEHLQGDGAVDQITGALQHGYGRIKDAVGDAIDDAPGAVSSAVLRGRELGRQGDQAIRERLGDNGPLYLIGGAIAIFALGAFALTRLTPKTSPKTRRPSARRQSTSTKTSR